MPWPPSATTPFPSTSTRPRRRNGCCWRWKRSGRGRCGRRRNEKRPLMDWLTALSDLRSRGEPCVLVTVVEARGSVPREPGAKLVVTGTAQHGTIGGGSLEFQATATARTLLQEGARDPLLREIPLGPALGQCCGGTAPLLLEPLRGPDRMLYLFGA